MDFDDSTQEHSAGSVHETTSTGSFIPSWGESEKQEKDSSDEGLAPRAKGANSKSSGALKPKRDGTMIHTDDPEMFTETCKLLQNRYEKLTVVQQLGLTAAPGRCTWTVRNGQGQKVMWIVKGPKPFTTAPAETKAAETKSTKQCIHYKRGNCKNGAACKFSHDAVAPEPSTAPVPGPIECKNKGKPGCPGQSFVPKPGKVFCPTCAQAHYEKISAFKSLVTVALSDP